MSKIRCADKSAIPHSFLELTTDFLVTTLIDYRAYKNKNLVKLNAACRTDRAEHDCRPSEIRKLYRKCFFFHKCLVLMVFLNRRTQDIVFAEYVLALFAEPLLDIYIYIYIYKTPQQTILAFYEIGNSRILVPHLHTNLFTLILSVPTSNGCFEILTFLLRICSDSRENNITAEKLALKSGKKFIFISECKLFTDYFIKNKSL